MKTRPIACAGLAALCTLLACGDDTDFDARGAPVSGFSLYFVVEPPIGSGAGGLNGQERLLQAGTSTVQLHLQDALSLQLRAVDEAGAGVATQLGVYDPEAISGHEDVSSAFLSAEGWTTLRIPEGRYDLLLSPSDPAKPGIWLRDRALGAEALTLQIPSYRELSGRVHAAVSTQTPVAGVSVQAIGADSRLRSTVATTDADGAFSLRLPSGGDTRFSIRASPPARLAPSWSYEASLESAALDAPLDIPLELASETQKGAVALQLVGIDAEGRSAAVAGAQVSLTSTITEPSATTSSTAVFRLEVSSDEVGLLFSKDTLARALPMLASRYLVTVTPPQKSAFAARSLGLDLRSIDPQLILSEQIVLSPRTQISGSLLSETGPVSGAWLSLIPIDGGSSTLEAQTSDTGAFSFTADPGRYALLCSPPSSSGLSGRLRLLDVADLAELALDPITLGVGQELTTELFDASGAPLEGAAVRAYFSVAGTPVEVAACTSDAAGRCTLRLPSGLEALAHSVRSE